MKLLKNIVLTLIGVAALICTAVVAAGPLFMRKIREWWGRCGSWYIVDKKGDMLSYEQ